MSLVGIIINNNNNNPPPLGRRAIWLRGKTGLEQLSTEGELAVVTLRDVPRISLNTARNKWVKRERGRSVCWGKPKRRCPERDRTALPR